MAFRYSITLIALLIGVPIGSSIATFVYAEGFSYLSSNPKSCINCHVMESHFRAWENSPHRSVAACNDCHTHGNIVSKYSQKAVNGFLHSWAFTTGWYHDPIQIKNFNRNIAMKNCVRCHSQMIEASRFHQAGFGDKNCLSCHQGVGHKRW